MHALGENVEEALQEAVPLLRIELLGELHRALHVGEQHGHLLTFAGERGATVQDLLGEMWGRVGARTIGESRVES